MFNVNSCSSARRATPSRVARSFRPLITAATAATLLVSSLSACSLVDGPTDVVNIGYQSKTLNTINAGTLLRDRGTFEKALERLGRSNGKRYRVQWHDFSSGAPLTAAMIATQVDIGSMGDYPLVTNGSKSARFDDAATELVATTGYNPQGSLNQVVVPTSSDATELADLQGRQVSTSLGSAGDGMLATALERAGIDPDGIQVANQDPSIGAAAIEGGQVDGLAQFVPWPQLMIFRGQARLLFDGGENGVPTFHGVVARKQFTRANPEVMTEFLRAMQNTSDVIADRPMASALRISELTGIEPEVAYLYNGPNGMVSFDPAIKPQFAETLAQVKAFLVQRGSVEPDFDVGAFTNDEYLRQLYGADFTARTGDVANPSRLTGYDGTCGLPVDDPATASEVWFQGEAETRKAATPTCLLRQIATGGTSEVRAGYVPDTQSGLKLFAAQATWVHDGSTALTRSLLPFATERGAQAYLDNHPTAKPIGFDAAVRAAEQVQ
ncbi:ABC transporter substrate-binding protein [Gordonia caeni]|uniref:ABC transporter substrate-binding protein n=1 Tax=Gordonia caeni TaxID=1007097 RepID=A0ABP7NKG1_9ACTN